MINQSVIVLNSAEIQSGSSRVDWAENLILQLPKEHEGRNSWLLNYGKSEEALQIRKEHKMKVSNNASIQWDDNTESLKPVVSTVTLLYISKAGEYQTPAFKKFTLPMCIIPLFVSHIHPLSYSASLA